MAAIYAWLRRHNILVDSTLAALLLLLGLGQAELDPWPQLPITLMLIAPVAFRRKVPATAFAISSAGGLWQLATRGAPRAADLAILVLLYTIAAYRPRRFSAPALIVSIVGGGVAMLAWVPVENPNHLRVGVMLLIGAAGSSLLAWVLGDSMRYRRGYYAALEEKAARLEAEKDAQAKIAAAAERARIARELHDVIAHHVSVMVVQADGAGFALRRDPDTAEKALRAIASTGRQALTEMRRLLGVLRTAGDQAGLAPVPGLGELRELLDQARAAGLAVSYSLTGTPRELPEGAELAAYRVVQESLTNTRKHAGLAASAAVNLRFEPDGLIVEVTDDGLGGVPSDNAGHGLTGMRERIQMYGGTVHAGPLPRGGFGVRAWLPCPQPAGSAHNGGGPAEPAAAGSPAAGQDWPAVANTPQPATAGPARAARGDA
jgi:signal transduction histidine kinase